jgi:hypothetical protein
MAWGNSAAANCKQIRTYAEADRYFNSRRKPRTQRWGEHQRPLYETRHTHFRLEKGHDEQQGNFYGVWLYRTELARYYEPKADGTHLVCYDTYWSNMTHAFMWHVLSMSSWRPKFTTTDGRVVYAPLKSTSSGKGEEWAAVLWFDARNQLIVEKSSHTPMALKRSSAADGASRERVRANVAVLMDMLALRLPMMLSESNSEFKPDPCYAKPFYNAMDLPYSNRYSGGVNPNDFLIGGGNVLAMPVGEWAQDALDAFFAMCQQLANAHVSVVACREGMDWEMVYERRGRYSQQPIPKSPTRAIQWVLDNPKEYLKFVDRKLMSISSADRKTGYKLLPQFPEDLPKTVPFYRADSLVKE